jgi:hypothetical protein
MYWNTLLINAAYPFSCRHTSDAGCAPREGGLYSGGVAGNEEGLKESVSRKTMSGTLKMLSHPTSRVRRSL